MTFCVIQNEGRISKTSVRQRLAKSVRNSHVCPFLSLEATDADDASLMQPEDILMPVYNGSWFAKGEENARFDASRLNWHMSYLISNDLRSSSLINFR